MVTLEYAAPVVTKCCGGSVLLAQGKFLGVGWVLPYLLELLPAESEQIPFPWLTELR